MVKWTGISGLLFGRVNLDIFENLDMVGDKVDGLRKSRCLAASRDRLSIALKSKFDAHHNRIGTRYT